MKQLKIIVFSLLGVLLTAMVTASVLEKFLGTPFVHENIYSSPVFVVIWAIFAIASLIYIFRRKLQRQLVPLMLHLSFVVILAGAAVTWLFGEQGRMDLVFDEPASTFESRDGKTMDLPFEICLDTFDMDWYEGTHTPMDYISRFTITDTSRADADGEALILKGQVSMNKIFAYRHYRFYQAGYDADGKGSILSVSHDPWGIGLTYTGYALLLLSFILFFIFPGRDFRFLLKEEKRLSALLDGKTAKVLSLILLSGVLAVQSPVIASARANDIDQAALQLNRKNTPDVLPKAVADRFGDLYVLYNDRVCPMQTLARDFTTKICGKPSYRGLSAEQVLTGWMFFYDSWEEEPMIKIKSGEARRVLGIKGKHAALTDYFGNRGTFKIDEVLDSLLTGQKEGDRRGLEEANEKLNIISMVCAGTMTKIFPHSDGQAMNWYAPNGELPQDLSREEWVFMRKSLDYAYELILKRDTEGVLHLLDKIIGYQEKALAGEKLSRKAFKAEQCYNKVDFVKPLAMALTALGILVYILFVCCIVKGRPVRKEIRSGLMVVLAIFYVYLTGLIALRWFVSGHIPLSNGYETMLFLSWVTMLLTLAFQSKQALVLPFGILLSGLAMMVSMMGGTNPQVTPLMPVLASPLLSIHVMVIMIAYALLAFAMLDGVTAVILHYSKKDHELEIAHLQTISSLLLYPAIFLLAIGIFIGAVWANVSWGRYWGWDPKETWALITMLIYTLALHRESLPVFRKPMVFHVFCIVAFLSVLITYFGVNFFLGGMHSYA